MRKILLATTALIAFAGAAQAAPAPLQVTLGGSVDFRAALFHESENVDTLPVATSTRRSGDFQTEYEVTLAAEGKAANGMDYGASITLINTQSKAAQSATMDEAYVWVSGGFGKVVGGDEGGASDLFVYAPTVGEGQIDGEYTNFTDSYTLSQFKPTYLDNTETDTKLTYITPEFGNAAHKVQLGVSFAPNPQQGTSATIYDTMSGVYKNQIEAALRYTGDLKPVKVTLTPMIATGEGEGDKAAWGIRDYTVWGLGTQLAYNNFTLGGSYVDGGHLNTAMGQNEDQDAWTIGLKYEMDKLALAANYMSGQGYDNGLQGANNYIEDFDAIGLGATYTWFPGLTTAADMVFFDQDRGGATLSNEGHVLMLSQKMTF